MIPCPSLGVFGRSAVVAGGQTVFCQLFALCVVSKLTTDGGVSGMNCGWEFDFGLAGLSWDDESFGLAVIDHDLVVSLIRTTGGANSFL